MKRIKIISAALVCFLFIGQSLVAQEVQSPVIGAGDLAKIYLKKEVVVVSTRKKSDFDVVHVTGAVHVDYRELVNDPAGMGFLKTPEELAAYLGSVGISETSDVVVYDDGSMKAATRVFWVLKYLGATKVRILDGGIDAWKEARKPVTSAVVKPKAAVFNVTLHPELNITKDEFNITFKDAILVDARENNEYIGEKKAKFHTRGGHIPGAVSIPSVDVVADGSFKSKDDIIAMATAAGVTPGKEIIVYCNSGVKAAVVYFALVEIAGFENVKLYEGSFNEWEADPNHEVVQ